MIGVFAPQVLMFQDSGASFATIQAVVRIPEVGPREEMALRAIADTILEETEEFSKPQILKWGSQTGLPPIVEFLPGMFRIGVSVPSNQLGIGIAIVDSLLRRARFPDAALAAWQAESASQKSDYWQAALWNTDLRVRDLRKGDLFAAYQRYFRPENVCVAIGGKFEERDGEKLRVRLEEWKPLRPVRAALDLNRRVGVLSNQSDISTIEISCQETKLIDPAFPAKMLASLAMGSGKGATLFAVAREKLHLSYRQELLFWPVPGGFRPRFLVASQISGMRTQAGTELLEEMKKSVESWQQADYARAVGIASAMLEYGTYPTPFAPSGKVGRRDSLEEATLLRCYWQAVAGSAWEPGAMFQKMRLVPFSEMKATAQQMLLDANVHVVLGLKRQ